ncbi:MAG TPA: DUF192 domain-containing protein [Candidatus Limnocylindria bacterium]|jgi:uncharacterized membrane protein (UPF0127 family)|nr:DUF192 domain-containing protein [Candidatus Limnocylindria bacterium]
MEARSLRDRLLGLAFVDALPIDHGLLLPGCRSIHTFGMRFAIDVIFLDARGDPLRVVRGLPPRRLATHWRAHAVIETRAGSGERFLAALSRPRAREAER